MISWRTAALPLLLLTLGQPGGSARVLRGGTGHDERKTTLEIVQLSEANALMAAENERLSAAIQASQRRASATSPPPARRSQHHRNHNIRGRRERHALSLASAAPGPRPPTNTSGNSNSSAIVNISLANGQTAPTNSTTLAADSWWLVARG